MFPADQESSSPYSLPSFSSFHNGSSHVLPAGASPAYGIYSPVVGGLEQVGGAGYIVNCSQTGAALGRALASVCNNVVV